MLSSALRHQSARVLACLALSVLAPSCGRLTEPEPSGQQLVHVVAPPHVRLTNQTDKPVFFLLMDQGFAARALWVACADATRCASLAPGASVRVVFARIDGFSAESERAVLYWWHADGAENGVQRPERIQNTSVQLR